MLTRIEIGQKTETTESRGRRLKNTVFEDLQIRVEGIQTIAVYTLELDLKPGEAEHIANELLADPVCENWVIEKNLAQAFDWLIEVGFRPGVTDNVARSTLEGIQDLLQRDLGEAAAVYTAWQYVLTGALSEAEVYTIADKLLANSLIEKFKVLSKAQWVMLGGLQAESNRVASSHLPTSRGIVLPNDTESLQKLSQDMMLALTLEEMQAIKAYFSRPEIKEERKKIGMPEEAMDVELEVIAQTWSEHCKHKIFAADIDYEDELGQHVNIRSLFKTYIWKATEDLKPRSPWLRSVFTDNAGVIAFTEDFDVCIKVETHNSPSALDPYGGAMTGIVGVNRDVLGTGMGCRPIFNTDIFCFAPPDYNKSIPERLLHPKRVFKGVHRGVRDGGNESGIPTVNGSIVFDERFLGKPLVFCGTGGIIPSRLKGKASWQKEIHSGDRIVMVGGRIGKDGIHGATFSSLALTEASPTSAVQIGDPITQKKLSDFLLEARDAGLYRFLTDNGAGGLSSSLGEMAREVGGCRIHLDKAPLKYPGLDPWEILVSEAQERMSFAVPPAKLSEFITLAKSRGVEASDLGHFTKEPWFEAYYDEACVCKIHMEFLHDGNPKLKLKAKWNPPTLSAEAKSDRDTELARVLTSRSLHEDAMQLLGRYNICSKESWVRQYDHEVQAASVMKPFVGKAADGPGDAAVLRPVYDSKQGLVVSHGLAPRYSDIDTYHMTACAIDEALRNAVAVGANPDRLSALDNFCWPDPVQSDVTPDGEFKLAQLVRSNQALYDYCIAFGLPLISGKDSMKNDYGRGENKISIPPTLLISLLGTIDDVEKCISSDFKSAGDIVYLLGETQNELGASEYMNMLGIPDHKGGEVPKVDSHRALQRYRLVYQAIQQGLIRSAHDCSDGGLFVALAECCIGARLGADIQVPEPLSLEKLSDAALLFSESQSRLILSVSPEKSAEFEHLFDTQGSETQKTVFRLGQITENPRLNISRKTSLSETDDKPRLLFSETIETLRLAWQKTLND